MSINLAEAAQLAAHAIGNRRSAITPASTANRAGRALYASHSWAFLRRPATVLSIGANQDHIYLPLDCEDVISVKGVSSDFSVAPTSPSIIDELRNGTRPQQYSLVYCVAFDSQLRPLLDVWPLFSTPLAGAIRVRYRAGWVDAKSDDDVLGVPAWLEDVYVEWVMEYSRALHHEDIANWNQRKADLLGRLTFRKAQLKDGSAQEEYGQIAGGAASLDRGFSAEPSLEPLEFP